MLGSVQPGPCRYLSVAGTPTTTTLRPSRDRRQHDPSKRQTWRSGPAVTGHRRAKSCPNMGRVLRIPDGTAVYRPAVAEPSVESGPDDAHRA